MANLSNSGFQLVIAIAAVAAPAILILMVPRRWLGRAILLWVVSPVIGYAAVLVWEAATRPGGGYGLGNALYGFMLISPLLTLPWAVLCAIGIGMGFLLRRTFRRGSPPAAVAAPPASPIVDRTPPQPLTMAGWRSVHVGFAKDGLQLGGRDVWAETWRATADPPVHLPHPAHPTEIHRYTIQEIGNGPATVRFAAAELSNGVWGFYVPTPNPEMARGSSANGTIRYEYSLGEMVGGRYDCVAAWALVLDGATGAVLADGSAWFRTRVDPQPDGSLFLHLSLNARDTLIRLDPETRTFRDLGAGGTDRPLAELAPAVEAARLAALEPRPQMLRLSPDGTIRVEIGAAEWGNTHWVHSPRVIDVPSGRVVLDLWNTDWDADISFPAPRRVRLAFRRYHEGGALSAVLDLERGTYQVVSEYGYEGPRPEAPLAGIVAGLEEAAARTVTASGWTAQKPFIQPNPWAAWRVALVIFVAAFAVIGAGAYLTERYQAAHRRPFVPDPMPRFEPPPIRR